MRSPWLFGPGTCKDEPATCSAQHDFINAFLGRIQRGGRGRDCGIEGSCSESCGANSLTKYEACSALAEQIRAEYRRRIQPVCPAPAPNQSQFEPQCKFPGCFGSSIPTSKQACQFALCNGDRQLGFSIACDCCSQCAAGPIPGSGSGTNPTCQNEPDCTHCCRWCDVNAAECPPPLAPLATEQPPAWQVVVGPD